MTDRSPAGAGKIATRRLRTGAAAGALLLLLSACSGTVQEKLGATQRVPDEFQVVRRAPLVVPPDYNLRPPGTAEGTVQRTTAQDAREIVTGSASGSASASSGEQALLEQTGVEADPEIRRKLLAENTELTQIDDSQFLFILDWQRENMTYTDAVIDPDAESARLRGEDAAGRVTTRRVSSETVTNPGGG